MKKFLIIRFSSIGDIVLTTPLIRCIKTQMDDVEIHYLTKKKFESVLSPNPHIDYLHLMDENLTEVISLLKKEKFDHIIDLHKNLRSLNVKLRLCRPSSSFPKTNFKKWLMVQFKINRLPNIHIVDRYFKSVEKFPVKNDGLGLDYYLHEDEVISINDIPKPYRKGFIGIVIGGMHFTKMLPSDKVVELISKIEKPIILLGGPDDFQKGEEIVRSSKSTILNACGKFTINQSASLISLADEIVTNDTGLMHIATAFGKKIISLWGNTIPAFGMYPYLKKTEKSKSYIFEVPELSCRPCSKIGHKRCPKKHFDCMNKQNLNKIAEILNQN